MGTEPILVPALVATGLGLRGSFAQGNNNSSTHYKGLDGETCTHYRCREGRIQTLAST